jgi:hypothetical protein
MALPRGSDQWVRAGPAEGTGIDRTVGPPERASEPTAPTPGQDRQRGVNDNATYRAAQGRLSAGRTGTYGPLADDDIRPRLRRHLPDGGLLSTRVRRTRNPHHPYLTRTGKVVHRAGALNPETVSSVEPLGARVLCQNPHRGVAVAGAGDRPDQVVSHSPALLGRRDMDRVELPGRQGVVISGGPCRGQADDRATPINGRRHPGPRFVHLDPDPKMMGRRLRKGADGQEPSPVARPWR